MWADQVALARSADDAAPALADQHWAAGHHAQFVGEAAVHPWHREPHRRPLQLEQRLQLRQTQQQQALF